MSNGFSNVNDPPFDPGKGPTYHTYPVYTTDDGLNFEGATKRYKSFPTPDDVFRKAMRGLPKFYPLSQEPVTIEDAEEFLESAVTEIEMSTNIDLNPVDHSQPFDYIDGMFESNFTGIELERWPAWRVNAMSLQFPHTQTTSPYQTYTIPSSWVSLYKNRVNVVAAFGAVSVETDQSVVQTAGGVFSYITGFGRGNYQPKIINVNYTSGFEPDKLPSTVWDLIVTLASLRFLEDIAAPLFPVAGVNVSIDGVSQSANLPGPQLLVQKIESLKRQYEEKKNAITRNFGKTIKFTHVGG